MIHLTYFDVYIFIFCEYWPLTLAGAILFACLCYRAASTVWRVVFFAAAAFLTFPLAWYGWYWIVWRLGAGSA